MKLDYSKVVIKLSQILIIFSTYIIIWLIGTRLGGGALAIIGTIVTVIYVLYGSVSYDNDNFIGGRK